MSRASGDRRPKLDRHSVETVALKLLFTSAIRSSVAKGARQDAPTYFWTISIHVPHESSGGTKKLLP
jgi:hypothetical protein